MYLFIISFGNKMIGKSNMATPVSIKTCAIPGRIGWRRCILCRMYLIVGVFFVFFYKYPNNLQYWQTHIKKLLFLFIFIQGFINPCFIQQYQWNNLINLSNINCLIIKVITKLPNSEQSYKGKVQTHNYINRQNQSTTGKLWKP